MAEHGLSKTIAILHRPRDSWRFECMRFPQIRLGVVGQIFVRPRQSAPSVTQRAFVFSSWLKSLLSQDLRRSSHSRSLALAGSGGQHRTRHGGFLSNNVEAGHVAQRSVRRLLFAFPSRLKRSSTRRSLALAGSAGLHETWHAAFVFPWHSQIVALQPVT